MPYIKDENNRRQQLTNGAVAENAGELNFQIFNYVKSRGQKAILKPVIKEFVEQFLGEKRNYQKYNDMTGCLVCCHKEIRRRFGFGLPMLIDILESYNEEIVNYENKKISENGDV